MVTVELPVSVPSWTLVLVNDVTVPVTLFIVVGACNATHVLDGLDGLCAGVLVIVHAGFPDVTNPTGSNSDVVPNGAD